MFTNSDKEVTSLPATQNHLAEETSPYLRQHADNPVDWYPWTSEALNRAKAEDKPILVSIGYAACHWCHVMEHESFEDPKTARIMNDHFICIKVDREERPDIDQIYMKFVQMTTGSGGWPLNVFLTPDQEPFYGGTYFPPENRYGRTSWKQVLTSVSHFYHTNKKQLQENIAIVRDEFRKSEDHHNLSGIPTRTDFKRSVEKLSRLYDAQFGGLGEAPKFPAVYPLLLFLRYYKQANDKTYRDMVTHTLHQMARGGIYDQIGGGFARYSVDAKWLVPHFEKMLYDNAQLVPLYLDTYLITADDYFLKIAEETLSFVKRELLSPEGGFYSSLDADSEGIEGKYYLWEKSEVIKLLGSEHGELFCDSYDITDQGNFEHKNILHVQTDLPTAALRFNTSVSKLHKLLSESKQVLLKEREKRVRPGLDDKILTSWNGLMLSAFARAYAITRKVSYKIIIENTISFLKNKLYSAGYLKRSYNRQKAKYHAYLDDYSFLIQGLLDSYEVLPEQEYINWAYQLLTYTNDKFWDDRAYGYFYTSSDQESLIERLKDEHDQSIPSGTAIMLLNNLRFYSMTGDSSLLSMSEKIIKIYADRIPVNPYAYASYLLALDFYLEKPKEIVLVLPANGRADKWYDTIFKSFLPNKVVMTIGENYSTDILNASLLANKKTIDGKVTAYVCHNFTCSPPVTTTDELKKLLE